VGGLGGPVDGLDGLIHVFFIFFDLLRQATGTASKKVTFTVTVAPRRLVLFASKNRFQPPENRFCSSEYYYARDLLQRQKTKELVIP
jgi:hypothetical protein